MDHGELQVPQKSQETWALIPSPPGCHPGPRYSWRAGMSEHLCGAIQGHELLPNVETAGFIRLISWHIIPTHPLCRVMAKILTSSVCMVEEKKNISKPWLERGVEFPEVDSSSSLQMLWLAIEAFLGACMCACALDLGWSFSIYVKVLYVPPQEARGLVYCNLTHWWHTQAWLL